MLVISVWIAAIKSQFEAVDDILTYPSLLSIGASLIVLFTSAVGIIGAVKDNTVLLRSVYTVLDDQMEMALKNYLNDVNLQSAVDSIQQRFECCGLNAPQSWEINDNFTCSNAGSAQSCDLPDSCCMRMKQDCGRKVRVNLPQNSKRYKDILQAKGFYTNGCRKLFLLWLEYNLEVLGATSLAFSIVHCDQT
ncbi:hypothetical protein HELRODRAFT_174783 [Helobdella robusta]|uniref:Tetraspanin n=1 Tax=Helobdella robusta TaxID=6412 RepID=T1F8G9_HELRO|nr:hypothetical protein HELRODRAFT_174783 [Helobdella robusta]ESO01237.1 hypothetical protein HELRODRAFT_174783 [Helobdella robusta]